MALIQPDKQQGLYMKISGGNISYTADKDTPGAVAVEYDDSKTGERKTTYKVRVPSLLGRIVGAEYNKSQYGVNLELRIKNGLEIGILQIKIKSSLHNSIVNLLMNLDVTKDVRISAWLWHDRTYVGFEQEGNKILPRNTKEKSEAPDAVQKEVLGELKWDFTKVTEYYYNYMVNEFTKKFNVDLLADVEVQPTFIPTESTPPKATETPSNPFGSPEVPKQTFSTTGVGKEGDDLPF